MRPQARNPAAVSGWESKDQTPPHPAKERIADFRPPGPRERSSCGGSRPADGRSLQQPQGTEAVCKGATRGSGPSPRWSSARATGQRYAQKARET